MQPNGAFEICSQCGSQLQLSKVVLPVKYKYHTAIRSLYRHVVCNVPVSCALFFLILGLQIFFQNIKVGGGKKNKNKNY